MSGVALMLGSELQAGMCARLCVCVCVRASAIAMASLDPLPPDNASSSPSLKSSGWCSSAVFCVSAVCRHSSTKLR